MRQLIPVRRSVLGIVGAALTVALVAAGPPKKPVTKTPTFKADETIGDVADIRSGGSVHVEGIGLVGDLDGTGSNPEPGYYRDKLVERMKKDGVYKADQLFETRNFALVLVKADIPIGVGPTDPFDVQVEVPSSSASKSLAGGRLYLTELREVSVIKGQAIDGRVLSTGFGPVLVGDNPRFGRVPGGAKVKEAIPYTLVLHEKRKSIQTSAIVQNVINERFHQRDKGSQAGMATAKEDSYLVLKVPHAYHNNQPRYFQVVSNLCIVTTKTDLLAERLDRWSHDLLDPKTAGVAALKLEGLGRNSIDALKRGLDAPDGRVRFFSAESLAYLGDASGAKVLADSAMTDPSFRTYALRALSAMDHPSSSMKLRELMGAADPDLRYGAFDALRAMDPRNPHLGEVAVIEDEPAPEVDEDDQDSMAIQLRKTAQRRKRRSKDPFGLFLVDCEGTPSIHVRSKGRAEVVVFGRNQSLQTPIVLGGEGPVLLNASVDDPKVRISRISTGRPDEPERKVECSTAVGDVVREMANLGASYPSIVGVLAAAERQGNLPGSLTLDSAPAPKDDYAKAQLAASDPTVKPRKDDAVGRAGFEPGARKPGLFDRLRRKKSDPK